MTLRPALAVLLLAVAGCDAAGSDAPDVPDPTPIALTAADEAVVGQSNAFGLGLFARVAAEDGGNLMLSPLSAAGALTMLLNGADGETYAQIRDALGYGPAPDLAAINASHRSLRGQLLAADPEVELAVANAVFAREGFPIKAPFLDAMRGEFDATVEALDFSDPSSVDVINRWASENTAGRVPRVLDEIGGDAVAYLLDALYFKGEWTAQFEGDQTAPADFALAGGGTVRVPTMNGTVPAHFAAGDGYTAVELAYGRRNFSMVLLLPDGAALPDFAARLDAGLWDDATTRLDAQPGWAEVSVSVPRFTFSYERVLNGPLQGLGVVDAFSDRAADLSRMSDARLFVSQVKQNTFVEVNEEGTEAAAVTTVEVVATSAGPEFRADRPFVFAIRERTTNTLLFIGQVANPAAR